MITNRQKRRLEATLVAAALGLSFVPQSARAEVTSVTVKSTGAYTVRNYTITEVNLSGHFIRSDASLGTYHVPAVLIYPKRGHGSGTAVVDWPNTVNYHIFGFPPDETLLIEFTPITIGDFIFRENYTYASVQWDKAVTDAFGPTEPNDGNDHNHLLYGTIERGADAWVILEDTAKFLKDPSAFPGSNGPSAVRSVFSHGYSQSGGLQMSFLTGGHSTGVYDGHLIGVVGLACWERNEVPPNYGTRNFCPGNPAPGNAKAIMISTQTELSLDNAFASRNPGLANWKQYELPGVAHLPGAFFPLGVPEQNPIDSRPVFRAMTDHLVAWIKHNKTPPQPLYIDGTVDGMGNFIPQVDADGNWLGGVRLPHMQTFDGEQEGEGDGACGSVIGAPLGVYSGLNLGNPNALLGGTFTPFSTAELNARYPSHGNYVCRVARAARKLAHDGYILRADVADYIEEAAQTQF